MHANSCHIAENTRKTEVIQYTAFISHITYELFSLKSNWGICDFLLLYVDRIIERYKLNTEITE